jgi:geranylgeranyl diphosphate/geranylgeranyl-bacteriochlorophyllide a reductase
MTQPDRDAVAVVGGSAAGLFAARLLASRGRSVVVYESAESLRPSARTLIVTSRMRDLLGAPGEASIVNTITRFELFANGRVATVRLERPDFVIERSTLIASLAADAEKAGAQLVFGRRFRHLHTNGSSLALSFQAGRSGVEESLNARTVIGADGAFSRVARSTGWRPQPTVPLVQATVRWPAGEPSDTAKVWFVPDDTPYFFWLIPESPDRGVLGLIGEDGGGAAAALQRFLLKHAIEPIEFQAARVPVYRGWAPAHRRLRGGDVYLVGDAGGHVKVTTIGGIVTGFQAALGVVDKIVSGSGGELSRLRRELNAHLLIRRILHRFTQDDYVRMLDVLGPAAHTLLSQYDRDQATKLLLRLCLRSPNLLLTGLRGLLPGRRFCLGRRFSHGEG